MNKIRALAMSAVFTAFTMVGVGSVFAQEQLSPTLQLMKDEMGEEAFAQFLEMAKTNPELRELYGIADNHVIAAPEENVKRATGDGLNPNKPFTFDYVHPIYKSHLDNNEVEYIVGYVQIQKLEESATTPEQKELFKTFKSQYDAIINKALERDNNDFVSAAKNLLEKAKNGNTNDSARWNYIKEGTTRYNDHFSGKKKVKATKAQFTDIYNSYRAYTKDFTDVMYERFAYTPDGKKISDHLTYEAPDHHEIIRKDLREKFGEKYGKLGDVYRNGKIYRYDDSGKQIFVCQIARDGSIWNNRQQEIGRIDYNGKIYINGSVKAEEKSGSFGKEYYIGKKFAGAVGSGKFSYADKAEYSFYYSAPSALHDAFALFLYKILPQ